MQVQAAMNALFSHPVRSPSVISRSPRHTVFFGLLPPADVAGRVHGFAETMKRSGGVSGDVRPARVLHVSLMPIGKDMAELPPPPLVASLRTRGGTLRQRPFTICLNRIATWGRPGAGGPVVALGDDGVVGAEDLHRRLAHAIGAAERADFTPHMTLLYGAGPASPLPIPPITWSVREFALIHSFVGQSRYEILGRFPLSA